MNSTKVKLVSAMIALVVAFVLLGSGTYAWFTMTTKTTISGIQVSFDADGEEWPFEFSTDGTHFSQHIDISSFFKTGSNENLELRPITTYDGVNWYQGYYDPEGNLSGLISVDPNAVGIYLNNLSTRVNNDVKNFVYFDVWVRTRDKNSTFDMKLTNPLESSWIDDDEDEYGTYVVGTPVPNGSGGYKTNAASEDASCCARIGFMSFKDDDDITTNDNAVQKFVIYEPNADKRSNSFKENTVYSASADHDYLLAYSNSKVAGYTTSSAIFVTTTYDPNYSSNNGYRSTKNITIYQRKTEWIPSYLSVRSTSDGYQNTRLLNHLGAFVELNESTNTADNTIDTLPIITLKCKNDGTPIVRKLRVFIWLEGQDIDCWNEIIGGGLYAHLEFKGDER